MRFVRVEGAGFRSFATPFDFRFPSRNGLFLVRGENQAQKALGANGAGKSTLFDAVCWCLYGKTSRGLTGPEVESWAKDAPDTVVELTLRIGDAKHKIRRARHPIVLTLDGEHVEQAKLDDVLGINYERFLQVVLMGQFGRLFTDMPASARLELVTGILGLELWIKASQEAAEAAEKLAADLVKPETVIATADAKMQTLAETLATYRADAAQWTAARDARRAELRKELKKQNALVDEALARHEANQAKEAAARRAVRLSEQSKKLPDLAPLHAKKEALIDERERLQKRLARIRALDSAEPCSLCGQEVSAKHKHKIDDECVQSLAAVAAKFEALAGSITVMGRQRDKLNQQQNAIIRASHEAVEKAALRCGKSESALRVAKAHVRTTHTELARLEHETNVSDKRVAETEEKINAIRAELIASVAKVDEIRAQHAAIAPWQKRFKELRLWIVEDALVELAACVNSAMIELGLRGWRIDFRVERETRSGSISRGFEVLVYAPTSPEGVPWEAWSGGETQRLRIACALGLATMIRARMPSAPDVEVWDEPTTHLHVEGVADLVAFFAERAAAGRQVWLVDHRSLDSGAFTGTVTVTKTKEGSTIRGGLD